MAKYTGKVGSVGGTDKEVKAAIKRLNARIRSIYKTFESAPDIAKTKLQQIKDLTTFTTVQDNPEAGSSAKVVVERGPSWTTTRGGKSGAPDIPQIEASKENIAFFKERIAATEQAYKEAEAAFVKAVNQDKKAKIPIKKRNVLETIDSMATAAEEARMAKKSLKAGKSASGQTLETKATLSEKQGFEASAAQVKAKQSIQIMEEIRAQQSAGNLVDISEVLDEIYALPDDDPDKARLVDSAGQKWTNDFLREINAKTGWKRKAVKKSKFRGNDE